jgi:magnesium transporter
MTLKEITGKILKGDFSNLYDFGTNANYADPSEIAHLLTSLSLSDALLTFSALPENVRVRTFSYLGLDWQKQIIKGISKDKAVETLNKLPSDDRFEFFSKLSGIEQSAMLEWLSPENRSETHDFLGYPKNSIARLVNTEFATITKEMTVAEAIEHLRTHHKDSDAADVIYVVDDFGKLIDDIPVRRFVLNEPSKPVEAILDGFYVSLKISDSKETAIDKFKEYDRAVLPVLNDNNVLIGVVTVDDVLDIAEQRDTKEIQKFGGVEALDYPYVKTPFFSLIKKRAGWLVVLFIGEMLTATAMGYFDAEISKAVVLALFIPLIISSGGNSGSQAATLIIRAMAVKELGIKDWWYVMRREILSGFTLGTILGTIGFFRIVLWQNLHWFNYSDNYLLVASTVALSLVGIVLWGTLSGSMIPIVLKRVGIDPAASSAPFVATLVDVTGLIIYFSIAAILLKGTLL